MKPNATPLNISDNEINQLIEYINANAGNPQPRPLGYGVTVAEYASTRNPPLAFTTARRILGKLVLEKKLKTSTMKQKGHIVTVYHK